MEYKERGLAGTQQSEILKGEVVGGDGVLGIPDIKTCRAAALKLIWIRKLKTSSHK